MDVKKWIKYFCKNIRRIRSLTKQNKNDQNPARPSYDVVDLFFNLLSIIDLKHYLNMTVVFKNL